MRPKIDCPAISHPRFASRRSLPRTSTCRNSEENHEGEGTVRVCLLKLQHYTASLFEQTATSYLIRLCVFKVSSKECCIASKAESLTDTPPCQRVQGTIQIKNLLLHASFVCQKGVDLRSYRDLNSDRWIQSPEC